MRMKKDKDVMYRKLSYPLSEKVPLQILEYFHGESGRKTFYDMHYELELGYLTEGSMRRFYPGGSYDCAKGDLWLCGMWEPHGCQIVKAPCNVMIFVIWPPFLADMFFPEAPGLSLMSIFSEGGKVVRFKDKKDGDIFAGLAKESLEISSKNDSISMIRKRLVFMQMCLLMLENGSPGTFRNKSRASCDAYSKISIAIDLVFSSKCQITNQHAANVCALSEDIFIRLFSNLMGISFAEFSRRHRISGAANALASSNRPIKEIAEEWGFTDQSHLHRLFLKYYSCSPNRYRTTMLEKS